MDSPEANGLFSDQTVVADQRFANTVRRLNDLLDHAFSSDVAHARWACGFADRLGVGAIVLVALAVRPDELGGDQLDSTASTFELMAPGSALPRRLHIHSLPAGTRLINAAHNGRAYIGYATVVVGDDRRHEREMYSLCRHEHV